MGALTRAGMKELDEAELADPGRFGEVMAEFESDPGKEAMWVSRELGVAHSALLAWVKADAGRQARWDEAISGREFNRREVVTSRVYRMAVKEHADEDVTPDHSLKAAGLLIGKGVNVEIGLSEDLGELLRRLSERKRSAIGGEIGRVIENEVVTEIEQEPEIREISVSDFVPVDNSAPVLKKADEVL